MAQQNWKKVAEDAQKALSSESRRHSEALERLGSIRVGLATVLRRAFPAHVTGVETALGGHLSDLPDTVLLGYLEAFAMMSRTGKVTTPNDLKEISRALRDSGFPMEDDATAVDMGVAIRAGFAAAKHDNQKQRRQNRKGKPKNSGAEAIKRDLSWAESQGPPEQKSPDVQKSSGKQQAAKKGQNTKPLFGEEGSAPPPPTPKPDEPLQYPLSEAEMQAIRGMLAVPVPRFMRDVVASSGSVDKAAAWEEWQRDQGNFSVIKPQAKHRQRGSLLIPTEKIRESISGFNTSPWGRALAQKYPAGRTYDLAVVMAKLADKIVATSFTKNSVELTYHTSHGIKAIIVGLSPGADPWLDVEEGVNRLLQVDKLQEILVIVCPNKGDTAVIDTLKVAARSRAWRMSTPVNVESMADWLNDDGRSSTTIPAS